MVAQARRILKTVSRDNGRKACSAAGVEDSKRLMYGVGEKPGTGHLGIKCDQTSMRHGGGVSLGAVGGGVRIGVRGIAA